MAVANPYLEDAPNPYLEVATNPYLDEPDQYGFRPAKRFTGPIVSVPSATEESRAQIEADKRQWPFPTVKYGFRVWQEAMTNPNSPVWTDPNYVANRVAEDEARFQQEMGPRPVTTLEKFTSPLIDLPTVTGKELETLGIPKTAAAIGAGVQQGVSGAAEFFTSPLGIETMGIGALPKLAQKVVSTAFVADMARHTPELVNEVADAWANEDTERLSKAVTSLGLNSAFIATGTLHTLKTEAKAEQTKETLQEVAPITAEVTKDQPTVAEIVAKPQAPTPALERTVIPSAKAKEEIPQEEVLAQPKPTTAPVKEPWQMSQQEFFGTRMSEKEARSTKKYVGNITRREMFRREHEASVAQAIADGKPVPPEVLADYPDLAPAQPTSAPETVQAAFSSEALRTLPEKTAGITPSGLPSPPDVRRMVKNVRQAFTVEGKLPREVHELQVEMEGARHAADLEIKYAERQLMQSIKETYGLSTVEVAGGGTRRIPPNDIQAMDNYLKGGPPGSIPANIRGALDNMRAQVDAWSDKTISTLQGQLNQLPPDSARAKGLADLIQTISDNRNTYLHRSYKFFDDKTPAPDWYEKLPPQVKASAEQYWSNASPTLLSRDQARSQILDWLSDLRESGSFTGTAKLGAKDLSMFLQRKDIPHELREVLGEYHSPIINYAKSVTKMAQFVAKQEFLNAVRQKGMGTYLFEEGANPPGFNARIAPEGSDPMSPLNGLRTSQDIADAFREMDRTPDYGRVARAYLTVNAWTKFANTALSLMTQSRNLSSRPFMAGIAGHWQVGELRPALRAVYEDFAGSNKTWQQFLDRMAKLGVIGDTSRASELKAILKDAAFQDVDPAQLYSWSLGRALKKSAIQVPGEIYRLSDELGNIYGFLNERTLQKKINPSLSDTELDQRAATIVREIYPTYSETPRVVKGLRKNVLVGPFVTFPYQVWRTMWNALSLSMAEIRSTNPIEAQIGWKRLGSQIATLGATLGAAELGKALLGISNQEEDDFRRFQPPWSQNSKWLFLGKDLERGELKAINLSYLDPYSYATDIIPSVLSSLRTGENPLEAFARATREIFRPWYSEQMLSKALIEARNGKTDSGREIYNPTDSSLEKFSKQTAHVMTALEPGTVQRAQKRIIPAIKGKQPRFGRQLDPATEILREASGVAVENFNFKNGLAFKARQFVEDSDAAENVFRDAATRISTTSKEQVLQAYQESDARRFAIFQELRADFLAALRRGVSKAEAISILQARGIASKDAGQIAVGIYEPLPITKHIVDRAMEINRELPIDEIGAYQAGVAGKSLNKE